MRVGLIHDTGRMYVAVPAVERLMETNFLLPGTFTYRHRTGGQAESVYEGETTIQGGEQRLVAVKSVPLKDLGAHHGFYAVASRSMDALLVEWGHENALMTGCHAGHGGIECGQSVVVPTLGGAFGAQGTACGSGTGGQPYQVRATGQHLALCVV
jgi:hypothetical protein